MYPTIPLSSAAADMKGRVDMSHLTQINEIQTWYRTHKASLQFIASILEARVPGGWAYNGSVAIILWAQHFLSRGVIPLIPNDIDIITNSINVAIPLVQAIGLNLNSIRPPSPHTSYVHFEKSPHINFEIDLLANSSRFGFFNLNQMTDSFRVISLSDLKWRYMQRLQEETLETLKYNRIQHHIATIETIQKLSGGALPISTFKSQGDIPFFCL